MGAPPTSLLRPLAASIALAALVGCNNPVPGGLTLPSLGSGNMSEQVPGARATSGTVASNPAPAGGPVASAPVPATRAPAGAGSSSPGGGAVPSIPGVGTPTLPGAVGIQVFADTDLHPASSYVLSTNRNHVQGGAEANLPGKLQALKALTPTWGQGRLMYRIGHGISDGRNDYGYMTGYHFQQAWNQQGNYPYDDVRFGLQEADQLDAEQLHVINFGTGTSDEAAAYVSYLDNPSDANRTQYPIAVQHARYFEIGNEISWSTERGHDTYAPNETAYATRARQFAQAMRAASPDPIYIGAVATTNSNWFGDGWSGGATTVKNILQTMGNDVDFLIFHGYPSWPMEVSGNLQTVMAQNAWNQRKLESEILPAIRQYATHPVFLANTEYSTELYGDVPHATGLFGTMYVADSTILAMNEDIRIANQFCFSHDGAADSAYFPVPGDPSQTGPMYKFDQMLAQHWGDEIVKTAAVGLPTEHVQGAGDSIDMPDLAIAAARGRNGHLYLMVLNRTNDQDVNAPVALGFTPHAVTAYTLAGSAGWDSTYTNTAVTSSAVDLTQAQTFKRASVTILDVTP